MEPKKTPVHNLIPEKEPNFSSEKGLYFSAYLNQFADLLEATVPEIKGWEDETVLLTLKRKGIYLSALDRHKLLAYKNFNEKECFITTPLEFCNIALVVNDEVPITDSLEPIDPAYCAWAIEIMERHDSNNEIQLLDEVAMYIGICFHDDGYIFMPENLSIFNDHLEIANARNPHDSEYGKKDTEEKILRLNKYLEEKRKELA